MTEQTTDSVSGFLESLRAAGARLVMPPREILLRAFDKSYTTRLAEQLGIMVPRSHALRTSAEASTLAREFPMPAVLKAVTSQQRIANGIRPNPRPLYARTPSEFLSAYENLSRWGAEVLAQEFIEGGGVGYFALMCNGELRAEFGHQRLRDVHPTGSGSSLRISVQPSRAVEEAGRAILKALQWHGVAMVEFRVRADGTPVFLEVNGRFWNSLALAIYAGCDFPAWLVELAEHGDVAPKSGYKTGVRCRWVLGDFRHLVEVWKGPPPAFPGKFPGRLRTLLEWLAPVPGTYHDNFQWNDPLPELGDWVHFLGYKVPARWLAQGNADA